MIIRGIITPLFYSRSKKKIKEISFLPPSDKNEVSVLRLDYTTLDFCKNHAKSLKIADSQYCGLLGILAKNINLEETINNSSENTISVKVQIVSSPLEEPNLPMHADIIYSHNYKDEEPKILMRILARKLLKQSIFFEDLNIDSDSWVGDDIKESLLSRRIEDNAN